MTIITDALKDEIIKQWRIRREWSTDKKKREEFPFFPPIDRDITSVTPHTQPKRDIKCPKCGCNPGYIVFGFGLELNLKCPRLKCGKKYLLKPTPEEEEKSKRFDEYINDIKQGIKEKEYNKLERGNSCYLYATFRKQDTPSRFDVDNFLKAFFDILTGFLLDDDSQIIGVKSNSVRVFGRNQEGVSFTLIPTYKLKVESVETIKEEEELDELNKLRRKYLESLGEYIKTTKWARPMQMITTNRGVFFDSPEGSLWSIEKHEKKFLHKPEPGFNWESKQDTGDVDGIMIYERSGCWWINKWAE